MEDLLQIYRISEEFNKKLEENKNEFLQKVRLMLHGPALLPLTASAAAVSDPLLGASPQQTKKRAKRLTSLNEDDGESCLTEPIKVEVNESGVSTRNSNTKILEKVEVMEQDVQEPFVPVPTPRQAQPQPLETTSLEVEERPPQAAAPAAAVDSHEFLRPQRAPRKNLKEPSLIKKIRRPSNDSSMFGAKIKQEHEQRQSQMLETSTASTRSIKSNASNKSSDASLLLVPGKAPSVVELNSDNEQEADVKDKLVVKPKKRSDESVSSSSEERQLRVMIKREKLSVDKVKATEEPTKQPANPDNDMTMETTQTMPQPKQVKTEPAAKEESSVHSNTINTTATSSSTTTSAATHTKKGKKKKDVPHRPIKVERFSEIESKQSPISSRTRHGSVGRAQRPASIYEDAVGQAAVALEGMHVNEHADTPPARVSQVPKEVMTAAVAASSPAAAHDATNTPTSMTALPNATMLIGAGDATFTANPAQTTFQVNAGQTTFVMENPNATVTIAKKQSGTPDCDATFDVAAQRRSNSKDNQSMVTARDTSNPADDSLITEDESYQSPEVLLAPPPAPKATALKLPTSDRAYKLPTRTNELFNPLVQSPVKKKVEAFEAAAVKAKPGRPKRTKENALPTPTQTTQSSYTTPQPGKLAAPVLGRFLTPTQSSNITPNPTTSQTKKLASSASKAMPFPKTSSTTLKATSSSAKATLSRENSGDDFRRGIHMLAEDRKKMREQKHLQAAQQREAKEKERAERMAKLAKEREEKRLKKQAELDQKKKAMEEIQRKLKQQEEQEQLKLAQAQSAKSKAIQDQERDLLQQMKPPKSKQHLQPAAKLRTKYTFEMLHEDDSTDEEDKVTYKRPAPPTWSRSSVRGPAIHMQQSWPTDIIDSFFSVQPMTPDLKLIFPNIDDRHLKRNSSAFWTTPPRYSDLPKY